MHTGFKYTTWSLAKFINSRPLWRIILAHLPVEKWKFGKKEFDEWYDELMQTKPKIKE